MDTLYKLKKKENVPISPRTRRVFTPEQKAAAVAIVKQTNKPISQVAQDLDLTESALRKWVKQAPASAETGTGPLSEGEREELKRLRRELKQTRMERDFLKKVSTFFAKENTWPTS